MTLSQVFVEYVAPVLFTGLAALLGFGLRKFNAYLDAKAQHTLLLGLVAKVSHFSELAVADVEATLRPLIKSAAADGQITPDEAQALRAAALARVKDMLGSTVAPEAMLAGAIEKANAASPK